MSALIIVPCYNEEKRLNRLAFVTAAMSQPQTRFLFVDDGSRDGTLGILQELAASDPTHFSVYSLPKNGGKAEAVRLGMLKAMESAATYVGFWDADLATPLDEIPGFIEELETRPQKLMVFGARVRLLGRLIERKATRHYLGRVFATEASRVLGLAVYDTQCGAKLFRANELTRGLFKEPFGTRWIFDVELIARLICALRESAGPAAADVIVERPLRVWHDVPGSKVRPKDFFKAFFELRRIAKRYRPRHG